MNIRNENIIVSAVAASVDDIASELLTLASLCDLLGEVGPFTGAYAEVGQRLHGAAADVLAEYFPEAEWERLAFAADRVADDRYAELQGGQS